jgi:hypothetical protein
MLIYITVHSSALQNIESLLFCSLGVYALIEEKTSLTIPIHVSYFNLYPGSNSL